MFAHIGKAEKKKRLNQDRGSHLRICEEIPKTRNWLLEKWRPQAAS